MSENETHVTMANDCPRAAYDDRTEAEARCFRENNAERDMRLKDNYRASIYWHVQAVPLNPKEPLP